MRIVRHYSSVPPECRGAVVALGNFDGVHLGHRGVIGQAAEIARRLGAQLGVATFEPHPINVLRPDADPHRLTPFRVKARRLRECGVELLFSLHFTHAFSRMTAGEFIGEVLHRRLGVRHVVVGHDYHFGKGRAGGFDYLREQAEKHGIGATQVAPVGSAGEIYSSTRVREYLKRGEPRLAAAILGHLWEVEARVRHGEARGRDLGIPTANLLFDRHFEPAYGIYAVWAGVVARDGTTEWHPAVASAGVRPTFDGTTLVLEVHIFDYAGDLYGRYLRVAFVNWIRAEAKFDDIEALKDAMAEDCRIARFMLEGSEPPADVGRTAFNQ